MKNIAFGLVLVVFLSFLVEPLVETAIVFKEKVVIGSAISNSCRAAKNMSLEYEKLRDMDAKVNPDMFMDYFSDTFEKSMNMTLNSKNGRILTFRSNDGKYNNFIVSFSFSEDTDYDTEQLISEVDVKAESKYKFKTKYLKLAEAEGKDTSLKLVSERKLILSVKN